MSSQQFNNNKGISQAIGVFENNIFNMNNGGAVPAQTRPSPKPCSTVPFKKDLMFIGREDVICAIKERNTAFGQRHERVALVGLAGVGKSQIAIEYSYQLQKSALDTWVFWIHARNAVRFEQGYHQIAAVAEIPGREDPKMNILQLVYQWLCDPDNGRWLMVLDNADEDAIFLKGNESSGRGPLLNFLPQTVHGSILITSRNDLVARNLVGSDGNVIKVQPMNNEESLALLRARIPVPQSAETTAEERALVHALEYIPLAITQAGSYIANRLPLLTVSAYLRLFHESEPKRTRLLQNEDSADLRRDPSTRFAVVTTWQLSFEQIRQEQPRAADLLSLMSMFDRQEIPENLLRDLNQDELDFHDALTPLLNFSLVRREINEHLFNIHHLVQLSVRAWLDMHQQIHQWQAKALEIMARSFPDGNYENWRQCQALLPHAKSVLNSLHDVNNEDRLNIGVLSNNCGWFLDLQGAYKEAEAMHRRALEVGENVLGCNHLSTLSSVSNLGNVLFHQGKYEEAELMYRRALEGSQKVLGRKHPETLGSVSNLGLVLSSQEKYQEAEAMHRCALRGRSEALGSKHPDTLSSVSNLGIALDNQCKYEEAEVMHRKALEGKEEVLGSDHPSTLDTVSNLGNALSSQGKFDEAEAMCQRALEAKQKSLGQQHHNTLGSVTNLVLVLFNQGRYAEAEALYRQALEDCENVLGREHPDTVTLAESLVLLLSSQREYGEKRQKR